MAKTKNKKRNLSENVQNKKEASKGKRLNPFEVHINKEKMAVLGRKNKNERGLPGVSRAKAIRKRKVTLLQEYKVQNKSNKFTDRRIGEHNSGMSQEEKLIARFAAVRKKSHNRKTMFNLADDEVLTHKGQTLAEIEKFDDPKSDDDEDEFDKSGKLDSGFVEDAHFGGGMFTRTSQDGVKSHKDLIDQLIAESKKRKAEKQKAKEATLELTEKLDSEWKDLLPLVSKTRKEDQKITTEKPAVDEYDKVMRELRFEARGSATDRLKTEEEIAQEEKEKLEELEFERIKRMRGFTEETHKPNHRSADDLDDDFVYESDPEYMLSYNKEGESNVEVDAELNGKKIGLEDEEKESIEEEESWDEADTECEDDLDDLKEEDEESEEETAVEEETILNLEEILKPEIPETDSELPFSYQLPQSYEDLNTLLENHSIKDQSVILERMIKCNHPSLAEGNKDGLGILFAYLLQYLNDIAVEAESETQLERCFSTFKAITPIIFDLAQLNVENAHNSIKEVIKEKFDEFRVSKDYPSLETLLFFKLSGLLFTTSDFRHQIITPCFVFCENILNKRKIKGRKHIAYGLFIVILVLEYTSLSKRYLPAAIHYLGGLLHMAIPKLAIKGIKVNPLFKATATDLVLSEDCSSMDIPLKMQISDLRETKIDDPFKIRVLYSTLKLIQEFDTLYADLDSNIEIFNDIYIYLDLLPTVNYPKVVEEQLNITFNQLKERRETKKLAFIVLEAKKPKALRLYEPKIVEIIDGKRRKYQSKEKGERDKLIHKLKKETKGAMREIRRDKAFLGRVKIRQRVQSDKARQDKVKRIFAEAAVQQSELNEMDRKAKRKK